MIRTGSPELWQGERRRTKPANWKKPIKWNKEAEERGIRYRVFCASLADVFDNQVPKGWRADLFNLIAETPNLDWLLLTKRPQNIKKLWPWEWSAPWPNIWLGTTVENQEEAERRIPHLIDVPASVRFLSCEPLLGPLALRPRDDFSDSGHGKAWLGTGIQWVIAGGESGPGFRPVDPDWFRGIRDQCAAAGVPFLFKQWEGASPQAVKARGRELDGVIHDGYPSSDSGASDE